MNMHQLYTFFLRYFRTRRMRQFAEAFKLRPETRVLDVGGTPYNWSLLPFQPRLTILNITAPPDRSGADYLVADGRQLPFRDGEFDIVYNNSVIEHLGDYASQRRFAAECRRVGRSYYVQTPNRNFFFEPHYIAPLYPLVAESDPPAPGALRHLARLDDPAQSGASRCAGCGDPPAERARVARTVSRRHDLARTVRRPDQVAHGRWGNQGRGRSSTRSPNRTILWQPIPATLVA
jgi:hypothetical protein